MQLTTDLYKIKSMTKLKNRYKPVPQNIGYSHSEPHFLASGQAYLTNHIDAGGVTI